MRLPMSKKIIGIITPSVPIIGEITASGKSTYEIWLDQGNVGTIQDFLNDLDKHYVHKQQASENIWNITHNLDKYPSVTVVDTGFTVVYGEIEYVSKNELRIIFTDPFSGEAYLN